VSVGFVEGEDQHEVRVAYSLNRRLGGAVERNRLRRRLRAAMQEADSLKPGAYLVSASAGAKDLSFEELKEALRVASVRATEEHTR
jgi:ribonuclease P protein component